MQQKTFNLRLWFAVSSLGVILAICAIAAFWLGDFLTDSLLERESDVSQELLEAIVAVNGVEMFHDDGQAVPYQSPALLDFGEHAVRIQGMMRVNIYAPTRRILWSTEPKLIGETFTDNDELSEALSGKLVASISYLDESNKDEHIELGNVDHFIEAYIPLRGDSGRGPVAGVMEFYRLPLRLDDTIMRAQTYIWAGAVIAALVLFVTLYWIVDRGARVIQRQQGELSRIETFAAIGQMSSAVAHSLRNPMAAIRSSAELWRSMLPPGGAEVADEITREVDRMDSYVRDLLSYARPQSDGRGTVEPRRVVDSTVLKLLAGAGRVGIRIATADQRLRAVPVKVDERLLEQALTTFLTNAIEAMPDGGTIDVVLSRGSTSRFTRISVSDTGRGIPAEMLDRVSTAYFTTKPGGMGLGLVLARDIVDRAGGRMSISSEPGKGTVISIELRNA
ncbi:MAG: ATP-binding protein [Devosia sp.]